MCKVILNEKLNGVELNFDNKPSQEVLKSIKSVGFRWHNEKKVWYAKQSMTTLAFAETLKGNVEGCEVESVNTMKAAKVEKSLFELTTWEDMEVDNSKPIKNIAKEVRAFVKQRFPMCKFSVTSTHNLIRFYITESIFDKDSEQLKAINNYCTNLLQAYKYCTDYNPYGDYGSSYNFYGGYANIDYGYTVTEQNEEQQATTAKIIKDFDNATVLKSEQDEREKEALYIEREKQAIIDNAEAEKRQAESKRQIEFINNSVSVIELKEEDKYFVKDSQFANLNKNQTLEQYKEEVENRDFYRQNVKITKDINFDSVEALGYFNNNLLTDFDFLEGTGGSYTDDLRFTSMIDYENMEEEERATVVFINSGVAVYLNDKLQYVIDSQGFKYARYVGLVSGAEVVKFLITEPTMSETELSKLKSLSMILEDLSVEAITGRYILTTWDFENWEDYKEEMKFKLKANKFKLSKEIIRQLPEDSSKLKSAMYKLLIEVDNIQEQFKTANILEGQKVTLFYISDFGSIIESRITMDSIVYTGYAQYDKAVKLIFTPEKKRKKYSNYFYGTMLVYDGWLDLPKTVLNDITENNDFTITSSKFLSCDNVQYDEIIKHFETEGKLPIVNTWKPII